MPSEVWSSTPSPRFPHLEDPRGNEPVTQRGGEPVDDGPNVDRAAELIEQRLVLRRLEDGKHARLLVTTHEPRRHARRLERRRTLAHVRPAYEDALAAEQPNPELALEPLPLSTRANSEPNEPLVVMPMPKHPRAARRLP